MNRKELKQEVGMAWLGISAFMTMLVLSLLWGRTTWIPFAYGSILIIIKLIL